MRKFFKLMRYGKPYWVYAVINIVFNLLVIVFSLVSFAALIPILQILFKMSKPVTSAPPMAMNQEAIMQNLNFYISEMIKKNGELQVLAYICVILVALYFLKNLFRYFAMFFIAVLRYGVVKDLRNAIYYKALILPLSYFNEQRKGDIISRITGDVQEVEWSILQMIEIIFRQPLTLLSYLIFLFFLSPQLTLFVLIVLPLSGLIIGKIGSSLRRTSDKVQSKMGNMVSLIEETISGLRIIKAFNAIDFSYNNFVKTNTDYAKFATKMIRKRDLASPLSEFLGIMVTAIILWYGGRLILSHDNSLDATMFLVYLGVFSQLLPPAKDISQAAAYIQKGASSLDRIDYILQAEEVIVEKPNPIHISDLEQSIEYRNVGFSYNTEPVLTNINLVIPKGKTIALVGPSGGGKSTMVDLLPRFYDITGGQLLIDGNDIRDIAIADVRGLMGIVNQDTILFNGTVYENISFGMKDVTLEKVVSAAKVANAHEFIEKLDKGYDTNIGDRGLKLSGGQRQRISIARAVLKNPPVLILDEATSALDTESERLVQDALVKLMENRTSVVIAHRLSTIQHADEIIVLSAGQIVQRGKHHELIATEGIYKKLCDMQSFS
ncbi:MAG: ABC transporter ATP-binding protein [Bacteroidales bacterium]